VPKKTSELATRGARHDVRVRILDELRELIGKREHWEALGDLNGAQAEVRAARPGAEWQARFPRERHALGLASMPPAPPPQALAPCTLRQPTVEEVRALAAMA
jgi:hypothetical protein